MSVRSFLITGPDENLTRFHLPVCMTLNAIDRRKQTVRYMCMGEDADFAIAAAKDSDVTMQEIVAVGRENTRTHDLGNGASATVSDCIEEYPLLHEGTHGMKWTPKRKR